MKLNELRPDLSSGFSVALVALPLSIGISLASGAPASAGLIAAIIGGIVGSFLGGTQLTINGPAAGLIVIVLDAITELGKGDALAGFKGMLAATVVAGALQIFFGLIKLGRKGSVFPVSVIHGMMAAIGLIILAKQTHILMGYAPHAKNPVMLYAELPQAIMNLQPMVFLIGASCLGFLIFWNKLSFSWAKRVPAPLVTVILGSVIAALIGFPQANLLTIPADLSKWIILPDFSVMSTQAGWKAAITLALVGSLETVLSAAAVDKIDPLKRKSNMDRDLFSKGVCNMLSASIGGLPMIAEIVRSSANISYGAKSKWSNFFHGSVILLAVIFLPKLLSLIPLASLAAVLIMVGGRLGNPTHFLHAKKIGFDNLVGFAVTLFMTLTVDLLVGIFLGAIAQFAIEIYLGLNPKNALKPELSVSEDSSTARITANSALTFCNFLPLKERLNHYVEQGKSVVLVLENSAYIDHSVMEQLQELKNDFVRKNLELTTVFSKNHKSLGHDHLSALKIAA